MINIEEKQVPHQFRNKYLRRTTGAYKNIASSANYMAGGAGVGIDIIGAESTVPVTDTNVMSSLRSLVEFISKTADSDIPAVINFIRGIKINEHFINRLLLKNTDAGEISDTDVMSALRVLAEITANNEELKKIFLRKDEIDSTNYLLGLLGGAVVENGLVVRLPKQTTPAALMSCLLEEDIDTLIEEDEDAIVEVTPAEATGDMTLGGLLNVTPAADEVDY